MAGEVLSCAKALNHLTVSMRVDLLLSQDVWQATEGKFAGDLLGEVKLTYNTGLKSIFSLSGYRDQEGQLVTVEASNDPVQFAAHEAREGVSPEAFIPEKKALRWLINNGSQIVGPLGEKEIATRLFAQELDFDCECWEEGTGKSAQIRTAGIFSGSEDPQAHLWMYDGETIHGPITPGFIKTAVGHGAIRDHVFVCEGSTVNGWQSLEQWNPEMAPSEAPLKENDSTKSVA